MDGVSVKRSIVLRIVSIFSALKSKINAEKTIELKKWIIMKNNVFRSFLYPTAKLKK